MPTFADFIAPFDLNEFKTRYYGQRPVHIRREDRDSSRFPLNWQKFNQALAMGPYWTEDTLKVFYKNRAALRENYCNVNDLADGEKALADPLKVKALLGLGASLVANSIHRICPEVAAVSEMLQAELAAHAGANVYCSFQGVQAFNTHFDLHDVFAFQVEGEKLWRVYEARADNPVSPLPPGDEIEKWLIDSRGKLLFEALTQPGDILYLPRGQYHDALTGAQASLHLTYWVKPANGLAIFDLLESALKAESQFRAYLPDANDTAALAKHLERLSQSIERLLRSPSFAVDVRNLQRSHAASSAGFDLPAQTRPKFYSTAKRGAVMRRNEGFVIVIEGKEFPLGNTHPAVSWAFTQRMYSFEDLLARHPYILANELQDVLQKLLAVGAIVETEMR